LGLAKKGGPQEKCRRGDRGVAPPAREERVLLLPARYEAGRPSNSGLSGPKRGSSSSAARDACMRARDGRVRSVSDEIQDALLDTACELLAVAPALAHLALDAGAGLAHLAFDSYACLADLALEAIAGGVAASLELTQLRVCLRWCPEGADRVVHAGDDLFASDKGGADGDQKRHAQRKR